MFYVYAYLDPRIPNTKYGYQPFYVGYGSSNRINFHLTEARKFQLNGKTSNAFKSRKIISLWEQGLNPILFVIKYNLSKPEAIDLECTLIDELKFAWDKSGCLTNVALGGRGGDTLSNNPNFLSGKIKFDRRGMKNPQFGKLGANNPKSKRYVFEMPDGTKHTVTGGVEFNEYIRKLGISRNAVFDVIKCRKPHHKGIKITVC